MSEPLTEREVNKRLDLAPSEVIDDLYSFGRAMLAEVDSRFEYLDQKANGIAGYSGAIVALIISTIGTWPKAVAPCMVPLVLAAALAALVAGGFALYATRTMDLSTFSANDWLREECIKDRQAMTKYWVVCLFQYRQTYSDRCQKKAILIKKAQCSFLAAGLMLFITVLYSTWFWRALLDRIRIG